MKIEIKSADIQNKSGTSKQGKPYSINEQTAYVHLEGKAYPVEMRFALQDGAGAYAPGFYVPTDASFFVDRFGQLSLGRLTLSPVAASASKAA